MSQVITPAGFDGALVQLTDITRFHEMEKFKDDYISVISHEFRTPLTSIVLGVEMLREGLLGELNSLGREIFEAIGDDCNRLTKLVDNLLELRSIRTIYIQAEPVEVADRSQAVRPLQIQADKRDCPGTDIPATLPLLPPTSTRRSGF